MTRVKPKEDAKPGRAAARTGGDERTASLGSTRLDNLRGELQFSKTELDAELEKQGKDYMDVADAVAYAVSRRDEAKDLLKEEEATVSLNYRDAALAEGAKKPTEGELQERVIIDPSVKAARQRLRECEEELRRLQALENSFLQRSYAIKELVELEVNAHGVPDHFSGRRADYAESRAGMKDNYRR